MNGIVWGPRLRTSTSKEHPTNTQWHTSSAGLKTFFGGACHWCASIDVLFARWRSSFSSSGVGDIDRENTGCGATLGSGAGSVTSLLVVLINPHVLHSTNPFCWIVIFTSSLLLIRCNRILLTRAQISSWLSTFASFGALVRFFGYTVGSNGIAGCDRRLYAARVGSCNHSNASLGRRNQRIFSV